MMDPLSALSLAAGIVQFIDFGTRLMLKTKEIAKNDSTPFKDLGQISSDLVKISQSLRQQIVNKPGQASALTNEEKDLRDLAEHCDGAAQDLICCLGKVMAQPGQHSQRWTNVRIALKTIWSKDKIDSLVQRLGEYRSQLSLRVLLLLNAHFETLGESLGGKLNVLQKGSQDIVEVLSLNHSAVENAITGVRQDQRLNRDLMESSHKEMMTAILTLRNGSSRLVVGPTFPSEIITSSEHTQQSVALGAGGTATNWTSNSITAYSSESLNRLTTCIRKSLYFQRISDREFSIDEAHARTFEWVFHEQNSSLQMRDSLSAWLENGKGCYWACGKAGSGKSTLLKFMLTQRRRETSRLLHKWAGPSHLIIAPFFFWYAGTPLQNSQTGLLRSILYTILVEKPGLAPILFPSIFGVAFASQAQDCIEFSFEELKRAFKILVSSTPPGLKMCFIVDGLDEYDGDPSELADVFTQAATSESVKVLLSSRPVPACVEAFSLCPKLRLQDLTKDDIGLYVMDRLTNHPLMKKMAAMEIGAADRLVHEITSKAEGVFLWVILVVKRLLGGLRDYDNLADLLQKLDELPAGLEKLYRHMLDSMDPSHRRQGSKLLQLIMRSIETHGEYGMTVKQLSFGEEENYMKAIETEPYELSSDLERWRYEVTEGRMRSRCCGLVEVRHSQARKDLSQRDGQDLVNFIHRTVVEFFRIKSVWNHLVSLTDKTDFKVDRALFNSTLLEMLSNTTHGCNTDPQLSAAYRSMLRMLTYEKHMAEDGKVLLEQYLPSLKRAMLYHWQPGSLSAILEINLQGIEESVSRCCHLYELSHSEAIILYTAIACNQTIVASTLSELYPQPSLVFGQAHNRRLGILPRWAGLVTEQASHSRIDSLSIRVRLVTCLYSYFRQYLPGTTATVTMKHLTDPTTGTQPKLPNQPFLTLKCIYDCVGGEVWVWRLLLEYARLIVEKRISFDQWVVSKSRDPYLDLVINMVASRDFLDYYAATSYDSKNYDFESWDGMAEQSTGSGCHGPRRVLLALLSMLWNTLIRPKDAFRSSAIVKSDRALARRIRKISMAVKSGSMNEEREQAFQRAMSDSLIGKSSSLMMKKEMNLPQRMKADGLSKLEEVVGKEDWSICAKRKAIQDIEHERPHSRAHRANQ